MNRKKIATLSIFTLILVFIAYMMHKADSDREGRIIFLVIKNNFESQQNDFFKLSQKSSSFTTTIHESYLNSLDILTEIKFKIEVINHKVVYTIIQDSSLNSETVVFELNGEENNTQWSCSKGTLSLSYGPKYCR